MFSYKQFNKASHLVCLVFCFLTLGCKEKEPVATAESVQQVTLGMNGEDVVSVIIPHALLDNAPLEAIKKQLRFSVNYNKEPILGEISRIPEGILFKPVLPFTPGSDYEVFYKEKMIHQFHIKALVAAAPTIVALYPEEEKVPENLLKMQIVFSKTMQEGQAMAFLKVLDENAKLVPDVFLDLQNELWSRERNILTVWLDPGRIKRDLQPNKNLGNPLKQGSNYEIVVLAGWRDADGITLREDHSKKIMVGPRDTISPDPSKWVAHLPKAGSKEAFSIDVNEQIDILLLMDAVKLIDPSGKKVEHGVTPRNGKPGINFYNEEPWKAGQYLFEVESRLEDLAGNNLERLFDRDLQLKEKIKKGPYRTTFTISQ